MKPSEDSAGDNSTLQRRVERLSRVLDVASKVSAETDLDRLLQIIIQEASAVLDADRCTLWILDDENQELWTKVAEGLGKSEIIRIPITTGISGQVAQTEEIINIPDAYQDERFNREVDGQTGYRTRGILAVPMRHQSGKLTGVLQALNRKDGLPFDEEDQSLLVNLGVNCAVAIENAMLHADIDRLFEGFVKASVTAIESRDPTTSGHSERVAILTLGIAENTARVSTGPYSELSLTPAEMRELRYASLLHDFGKVGVRENVLVKAKKLYPWELQLVESRFQALKLQRENHFLKEVIQAYQSGTEIVEAPNDRIARAIKEIDEFLNFIRECNEPTVLASEGFERLQGLGELTYVNLEGNAAPILSDLQIERLSIPRGSLDPQERLEIESHVTHTFRFLQQIPWTKNLQNVPQIAFGHHEKLDGTGYPRGLNNVTIAPQTRMMTIADIYDALTARDRPYKKAVPIEKALNILEYEAKNQKIDPILLDIFIESKTYQLTESDD
uniref:HD-GYP domain n=1 Tax=uncultured myxobacterium HF0200_19H16 TaxID=723559 RepID=E7C3X1_9BACT|nr:HD-GYP domain [uncultured myxobacterium HF0200_19H16]